MSDDILYEKSLDGATKLHITKEEIDGVLSGSSKHLCWECSNAYTSKCSKIADLEKGPIDSYPFIRRGFQLIKDGELIKFAVIDCSNFIPDMVRSPKEQSIANRKVWDIIAQMATVYYDTDTVEEAWAIKKSNESMRIKRLNRR